MEFNLLLLVSIVWPIMYRSDDQTEQIIGENHLLFLLLLIFCVYIFHLETLFLPSSLEFELVPEKLIDIEVTCKGLSSISRVLSDWRCS